MNLREFFVDEKILISSKLFGKTHLFLLISLIIILILIYKKRLKLYKLDLKVKRNITIIISSILLLNMLILYVSSMIYHNFDYKNMLPLHLCYMANYFYIITILFKKDKIIKYNYFLAFLGPIPAIVFFDVPSLWESFNFYLYIISHHFLVIGAFLTFYMNPKELNKKDMGILVIILNVIYIIMNFINNRFKTNYFFSKGIPKVIIDFMPFLKRINVTIILEFVEILLLIGLYAFFRGEYTYLKNCDIIEKEKEVKNE